jgi:membrane-associated protease RseP (regulator of RpoE activity)
MERNNNSTVWIIVVGVLILIVACFLCALLGGLGAYALAYRATESRMPPVPSFEIAPDSRVPVVPVTPAPFGEAPMGAYAMVVAVTPNSPAEEAGIIVGDIITHIDSQELSQSRGPADIISGLRRGDTVDIVVLRGNETMVLRAVLGRNPENASAPWLGITYRLMEAGPGSFRDYQGD